MTSAKPPLVTAEELLLIPEEHARCDLIRGEVVWTPLLWVLEPTRRFVLENRDGQPARVLRPSDTLDAGDVLPGFTMSGAELFEL